MRVALFGRKTSSSDLNDFFPEFFNFLRLKKIEIQVEEKFFKALKKIKNISTEGCSTFTSHEDLWGDLDLFFTFGGDGTILNAVNFVREARVPIVGINTGRLGFLASINKSEIMENIDDILAKNFKLSQRSLLCVESEDLEEPFKIALNEISVLRKETTSMITIDTYVDDVFLNSYWADGLIIATPTGSTGYSLSCNGPIITPTTENFVITPIAPHHLNVRPLIISDKSKISLEVHSRVPEFSFSLDSRLNSMPVDKKITIRKADFSIFLVDLNNKNYLETLRKKLFWGKDSRNQPQ